MAAGGPVKELCEEATCSICLDYFEDPVTIAECGHNFCRACLTRSWGETGAEASCPRCRGIAQPGSLRPNQQLANFVEIAKKFTPQERKEGEVKRAEGKEAVCGTHQEPLILYCKDDEALICMVCCRSKQHRDHKVTPLEEASQENSETVLAAGEVRACEKHQKPLKLFCKDDDALMCMACEGCKEHEYHDVIPLEEAAQGFKDDLFGFLEILKTEKANLLAFKSKVVKESQDLLKQTKADKQKTVAEFRKLREFLEIQEQHLLAQVEEVEKELARKRVRHLARFSEELSSLESLIREMEEKIQQPVIELLQDVRSTLQRFEGKEKFETPVAFPIVLKWKIRDFWDISHFLDGVMKQFKDTLVSGLQLQKANVTLDPNTAHPFLLLSEDRKSIRVREKAQNHSYHPDRFENCVAVLGSEGFTTGQYFWEVVVGPEKEWAVGIARRSLERKGWIPFSPEGGIWAVGMGSGGGYVAFTHPQGHALALKGEVRRIRVVLNCDGGQVSFFDSDTAAHLYTFSGFAFSGKTLKPFFRVREKGHLQLYP